MSNKKFKRSTILYTTTNNVPTDFMTGEKEDFRLSRWCLRELTRLENLNITNHLHMEGQPNKLVSISHTKTIAACALCVNDRVRSIGIDIEWSDRKIREGSYKYFVSEDSELKFYGPIEIWCIKEAAFKAYSPFHDNKQKVLVLTDFTIIDKECLQAPNGEKFSFSVTKELVEDKELILVLAEY